MVWEVEKSDPKSLCDIKSPPKICQFFCMRNTNKSPKITYFATVLEVEKSDPKSVSDTRSPLKMNQFFRLIDIGAGTVWDVWDSSHTDFVACGTSMHSSHTDFGPVLSFIPSAHPVFYRWNVCKCK